MVKLNKNSVAASFCYSEMKMVISKNKRIKSPQLENMVQTIHHPPEAGKVDTILEEVMLIVKPSTLKNKRCAKRCANKSLIFSKLHDKMMAFFKKLMNLYATKCMIIG